MKKTGTVAGIINQARMCCPFLKTELWLLILMRIVFLWCQVPEAKEEGVGPEGGRSSRAMVSEKQCGWKLWGAAYVLLNGGVATTLQAIVAYKSTSVLNPFAAEARIPRTHEDTSNF